MAAGVAFNTRRTSFALPDCLGAECVVWQFADQFVETVPKNQVPEWKRHRYTELTDGKLALTQPLAEAMLLAAIAELWQQGLLQFRLAPKRPTPLTPTALTTKFWCASAKACP
jgi:hypothetical protein